MTIAATLVHRFYMRRSFKDFSEEVRRCGDQRLVDSQVVVWFADFSADGGYDPLSGVQDRGRALEIAVHLQFLPVQV